MTPSTALAPTTNNNLAAASAPSADEWRIMREQSQMLIKTGFLPQSIKTPEQAIAIMLQGRELGIATMAALSTINVIQGKPTVSPQLMLALINRSGQVENIEIRNDPDGATCTMKRKGRTSHTEFFGQKEAQAMGLTGKDNYKKQAATMFRWRAVAACARVVFPDVILGLYTPDEMGATVNEIGEIIPEPAPRPATKTQLVEEAKETSPVILTGDKLRDELINLCRRHGKSEKYIGLTLTKFDRLPTEQEKQAALDKTRVSLGEPAAETGDSEEREVLIAAIGEWMTNREWEEGEEEAFLIDHDLDGGLIAATTEDLRIVADKIMSADEPVDGEIVE